MAKNIAFLGAGNMAEAILKGALDNNLFAPEEVMMSDISEARREYMQQQYGVHVTGDNAAAVKDSPTVVLAVKPQQVNAVLAESAPAMTAETLLLSICAGITTAHLEALTPAHVIRVMPNLPAAVQMGVSVICAGKRAGNAELTTAEMILLPTGKVFRLPEDNMNAVTAVSGSGPGYVFAMMEAMEDAAVQMGIPAMDARKLVIQTIRGAAELALHSEDSPYALRERVSSRGGTTLAALAAMDERGWSQALKEGMAAACRRAVELEQ